MLESQIAVRGKIVYTMDGESIENGVVLIRGAKIERVGGSDLTVPPGYRIIEGAVVAPGFIDAHSVVGLAGMYNYEHDQDQIEYSNPVQPELRAFDAFNPHEGLVEWVRNLGITTLHTGHAPGALASGQTMIVKTTGDMHESSILDSSAMVAFTLGSGISSRYSSPGTRSKAVALLRAEFIRAREYLEKKKSGRADRMPAIDLELEALSEVLEGRIRALITAHTATDILAALRLSKEFGFIPVLDGAAESYLLLDELHEAAVPVLIHPTMIRPVGDARNASFETAAKLHESGIPFAFQSGYESYVPKTRIVRYEAAIAVSNGLSPEHALAASTIDSARLLGIDDRVGSLAPGKDADLIVFDGDPFEYLSKVCLVIINGIIYKEGCE